MTASEHDDTPRKLALIADELRSLARNNLLYLDDPYQIQRNRRVLELAAALQALADVRPFPEIRQRFFQEMDYQTPLSVVDTAVLDPEGRVLLIRRADNGFWALPGGACDVGETPAEAAARETWEETGYQVEITRLLGVFDERFHHGEAGRHLYVLLFAGVVTGGEARPSPETTHVAWFSWEDLPWQELVPSHHRRLQMVMQWWLHPHTPAYFD